MTQIKLSYKSKSLSGRIQLESSKSESNRVLLIQALIDDTVNITNISNANDSVLMEKLLKSDLNYVDAEDAGTTFRFLTAYFSIKNGVNELTGTDRMKKRPIGKLVDALSKLGMGISYLDQDGYPPLKIDAFKSQRTNKISIDASISSQFITALLLVSPELPLGLELELIGKISSRPYIEMTINLMKQFGAKIQWDGSTISVAHKKYTPSSYVVESDWSGASYWYSMLSLTESGTLLLNGLRKESNQGDSKIAEIMESLGVKTTYLYDSVRLEKIPVKDTFEYDFSDCPDLAQTVIVICAMKGIKSRFSGLNSLRIKETDRISALQNELKKCGIDLIENNNVLSLLGELPSFDGKIEFDTYLDHRMAMALAPISLLSEGISIGNPSVVKKSYPTFWKHLKEVGFESTLNEKELTA